MLVCLACFEQRIASLLENASHLMVFALDQGRAEARADIPAPTGGPQALIALLRSLGVRVLVCGALDGNWERALLGTGIRLRAWVGGNVEEILDGLREGRIGTETGGKAAPAVNAP
jgi:predicted Fe-Mo cluster-binding NifX family protein